MSEQEIMQELNQINSYLSKCLWMDFEFCQMSFIKIVLSGKVDELNEEPDIEIEFEYPYFISTVFLLHTDTSKPFIQLVSEDEEYELNTKYQVEYGNYIFKINVEDFEHSPMFVAAKKIKCKILNRTPF